MTTLLSIHLNTKPQKIDVYVIYNGQFHHEEALAVAIKYLGMNFHPVKIPQDDFKNAPVTDLYPTTIYYRLLAHGYLPKELDRILYLDADILCINDLQPLMRPI